MITKEALEKKKSRWTIGIVLGVVLLLAAVIVLLSGMYDRLEVDEPEDLFYADHSEQYVYVPAQYILEAFGTYESYAKMSLYFVFNDYFDPYIVCMDDTEAAKYADLMNFTYSDSAEECPMQDILGYAKPFDREIKELAIECYNEAFEGDYVTDANFEEFFGEYYLQTGKKSGTYGNTNLFLILLIAGIIVLLISVVQKKKLAGRLAAMEAAPAGAYGQQSGGVSYAAADMFNEQKEIVPGEVRGHNRGMGIIGAFFGALLGSLLIVVLGMAGFISGWAAVVMALLAINGYKFLAKGIDKAGIAIAIIFTALMILPANIIQFAVSYYQGLNDLGIGYISFWDALLNTPQFMSDYELWGDYWYNVILGYMLGAVCLGAYMPAIARNKQKYDFSTPGNAPTNIYGATDAYGERRMEVTLELPKTGTRLLYIMCAFFAGLGLFMGISITTAGEAAGGFTSGIIMLAMAALMFFAGKMNKGITYTADEWGVRWYRPFGNKHIDIAYREMTEINLTKGQCLIKTAERKKRIAVPLASFDNGRDFAYVVQTGFQKSRENHDDLNGYGRDF